KSDFNVMDKESSLDFIRPVACPSISIWLFPKIRLMFCLKSNKYSNEKSCTEFGVFVTSISDDMFLVESLLKMGFIFSSMAELIISPSRDKTSPSEVT
ncbi:MAG TPA: hypothetical protein VF270_08145, partial [Ignavibacteriaceae bacterium]